MTIENHCGSDGAPPSLRLHFQAFHGALSEPKTHRQGHASGLSGSAGSWNVSLQMNQLDHQTFIIPNWTTAPYTCLIPCETIQKKKFYLMSSGLPYQYMTENLTRHSLSVFFRCPASHQHSWRCWWLPACRWLLEVHQVAEGLHSKNEQHFGHDYRYPWVETSGIYPACFLFFCSSFCASASGSSSSSRKSMVFSWTEKVVGFQNHSKQLWLVFGDSKSFDSPCWSSLRSLLPSAGRGHSAGLCFCLCLWLSSGQPWWYCWGSIWPHKNSIGGGGRGPPWVIWERPMISVG